MTDLGVFCISSWAAWNNADPYTVTDWNGWHYHYPPFFSIIFGPFSLPPPTAPARFQTGELPTRLNTPWGFELPNHSAFYGFHGDNIRFFVIVSVWYLFSVAFVLLGAHIIACVLEGCSFSTAPPSDGKARSWWWLLRLLQLVTCCGSIFTCFARGQVDCLILFSIAIAVYFAARHRDAAAGICFAFPATIKLFPPFILIFPFWRRRWGMCTGLMIGLLMALIVVPVITLGSTRTSNLYQEWFTVLAKPAIGYGVDQSRAEELTQMGGTNNQSLLAAIHNWRYLAIKKDERPRNASPEERNAVYAVGLLMLIIIGFVAKTRTIDSPEELLSAIGLLIGLTLVVNPIVHDFYYLRLMPLIGAILSHYRYNSIRTPGSWKVLLPICLFAGVNLASPLPVVGTWLEDLGIPLLSMIYLMWAGLKVLARDPNVSVEHKEVVI